MPMNRVTCQYCGKDVSTKSRVYHETKACPKRPEAGKSPAPAPTRARRTTGATTRAAPSNADVTTSGNGHCADCLFRGLDSALARELVTDAVRGGMSLETAAGFVRRALQVGR